MKLRRQRKHRSRAQRREDRLRQRQRDWLHDRSVWCDDESGLEVWRRAALDPATPGESLLLLAPLFPREVRQNPAFALHSLSDPALWTSALEHYAAPKRNKRSNDLLPRGERTILTSRFRRKQRRTLAWWDALRGGA